MKTHLTRILLAGIIFILLCCVGCKKDSGPAANDTATLSGSGSDYFPVANNQTFIGKATGQSISYDILGNVMQSQSINQQEVKGWMGGATTVAGMQAYPLFALNTNGTTSSSSSSFIAQSNQGILGLLGSTTIQTVTVIPAEISIGTKWIVNPSDPLHKQISLQITDSKSSYTNSTGKTYSNVIKVNGVLSDSTSETWNGWISYLIITVKKGSADLYFAKGIGLVDIQLNNYEEKEIYYYGSTSGVPAFYNRTIRSGTLGKTN